MKVLYFTHCCAKKDDSLKNTQQKVTPKRLYQATPIQRFMKHCDWMKVDWAIFSDKYGFVFPDDKIEWYEKHPKKVTESEKVPLFSEAFKTINHYDLGIFYYNPGRIHPLYKEMIYELQKKGKKVKEISHLTEIK